MGGSGGGGSGRIGYPVYITWFHYQMMSGGVQKPDFTAAASGAGNNTLYQSHLDAIEATNPYSGVASYNPATNLTNFQTEITRLSTLLREMTSETDWDTFVTHAIASVDEALYTEAQKEEAIRNFSIKQGQALARSYNRMTGAMNDINAVAGTAFLSGMAILEAQHDSNVAIFRSQMETETGKARVSASLQIIGSRIQALMTSAQLQGDYARISTTALTEQIQEDVKLDKDEIMWEHEIFLKTTQVMAAMGGGTGIGKSDSSKGGSLAAGLSGSLTGAMSGAALGAMKGTAFGPGVGTAIGAGVGLLSGLV
jgi:hypothetical protein